MQVTIAPPERWDESGQFGVPSTIAGDVPSRLLALLATEDAARLRSLASERHVTFWDIGVALLANLIDHQERR